MRKVFRQVITGFVWSRRDGGDMLDRWLETLIPKEKEVGETLLFALQPKGGEKKASGKIPKGGGSGVGVPQMEEKREKRIKRTVSTV